jgi:hypothetical protein
MNEELQMKQNELDELNAKRNDMEDELAVSKIKQQACRLNKNISFLMTLLTIWENSF